MDFPYGARLRWAYRDLTFSGARTQREVQYRYLTTQTGGAESSYTFSREEANSVRTCHSAAYLDDPSGPRKAWFFYTTGATWQLGLQYRFEDRPASGQTDERKLDFTWFHDTYSSYVQSVVTTLDPGTGLSGRAHPLQLRPVTSFTVLRSVTAGRLG